MENQQNDNPKETFTAPRHWIGPDELDQSYWNDPQKMEKRGQEFFDKPVEWLDFVERTDQKGIARRDFLTVMGASMAMATFACARRPVHKIIPYVVKPEEVTPGVATWYASTCKECSSGCGVLAKTREGRPVKLEGNPDHPVNRGALCARGQASVLNLYDPDRLHGPVLNSRGGGMSREVAWKDADALIQQRLRKAVSNGGKIRVLTGKVESPTTYKLIREFLAPFKSGAHVEYEPLEVDEISESQEMSYGSRIYPEYRFDMADVVVSLGADFLGTWISPVEHASKWSKKRKLDSQRAQEAKLSKFYCFESTLTTTGSSADERIPIRPGDELKIALAIAHELIVKNRRSVHASNLAVVGSLGPFRPEIVAEEIGVENGAALISKVAVDLWNARGRGLVVAGGIATKTKDSLYLQLVVNLLNSALENEGSTVDGTVRFRETRSTGFQGVAKLIAEMKAGDVEVLIIHGSNPAYTLPRNVAGLEEGMKRVPLIIAIADRDDETAKLADYVLPDLHYLENWGDASVSHGVYSLQQPTLAPIYDARSFEDSMIIWSKGAGVAGSGISKAGNWHEYLQNNWRETVYKEYRVAGNFDQFWEGVLRDGVFNGLAAKGQANEKPKARSYRASSFPLFKYAPRKVENFALALYPKITLYDGRSANNAWLQETPDPISSITWDNYVNVAPLTAKKLGLKEDDVIEVSSGSVSAQFPVHVQPGLHPSVVSIAVGYGRRSVGKVGNQAGVDVFPFLEIDSNRLIFSGQDVKLRKTQRFYKLASTQWHTVTENRPILNDITLATYRKNPAAVNDTDPELKPEKVPSIWPKFEYKEYRWGMAIDLTSCTGCAACVIACQAENNVPVVGRDQVRNSRQMHWLRIDRYFKGTSDNPGVVFQPMLCQQCENAPCETVCPVLATLHDSEGLNLQVYNRCVGTRYCQNNCPYKVRRFNFFDHWKSYEGTMNMVWNPDVTVRSRGIMEKCTFCVQRIREGKDRAKDVGGTVMDGEIKTACQQTCPTDAIVFGNMNDPKSRVAKLRADERGFKALEVLNTVPSISYLTKVRNTANGEGESHV